MDYQHDEAVLNNLVEPPGHVLSQRLTQSKARLLEQAEILDVKVMDGSMELCFGDHDMTELSRFAYPLIGIAIPLAAVEEILAPL